MKGRFETNIAEVFEKFVNLTTAEMSKAMKRALNTAAKRLQQQTKTNLEGVIKQHGSTMPRFNDYLKEGVIRYGAKGAYDEDLTATVHIMGKHDSGTSTFILRMLENGTKERYATKYKGAPLIKPRYTGAIKPMKFFKAANDMIEPQLEHIYTEEIGAAIQKINATK